MFYLFNIKRKNAPPKQNLFYYKTVHFAQWLLEFPTMVTQKRVFAL